jgi:hypothetical protein
MKTRPSIVRSFRGGLLVVVGGSLAIWDSWKPLNRLFVYLSHYGHVFLGILAGFFVVIGIYLLLAGRRRRWRLWHYHTLSTISSDQAMELRQWLADHGFHMEEAGATQPERWFLGQCLVKLICHGERTRIEIRHGDSGLGLRELDELTKLRSNWPEAATMSPIELATSPQLHSHRESTTFRREPGKWLYRHGQPSAHGTKVVLQMIVGVAAVIDIGRHFTYAVTHRTVSSPLAPPIVVSVNVIAYALAVAAAIELAYTLFTPGPDEALDPLMLGLASGILLLVTSDGLPVTHRYFGVLMGVLALAGLFLIRRYLLRNDDE